MVSQPIELRDLQLMQIGKTHNAKEDRKLYYIMLKKDEDSFTVFTSERGTKGEEGFVMNCITKKLLVDVCFTPDRENVYLTNYVYQGDFERFRKRAIEYLTTTDRSLKPQEKTLLFEIKANESIQREVLSDKRKLEYGNTFESIQRLEEEAQEATPERKEVITYYIERGTIARTVKQLANFECLICKALKMPATSFIKRNSDKTYIETHHIEQVSNLKKGSLAISNLITVCANHHRQFHYGNLAIVNQSEKDFYFEIDGQTGNTQKLKI